MVAANTKYFDLPFLDKHVDANGRNKLCWNRVLVNCTRKDYTSIHERERDLLGDVVEEA